MATTFILEPGYASVHGTEIKHILSLIEEITSEILLEKCKSLGIEKLKPKISTYREYCKHYLIKGKGYFVYDDIQFDAGGGGQHRNISEFVVKTLCLLVLEKAIEKEYMINFRSI